MRKFKQVTQEEFYLFLESYNEYKCHSFLSSYSVEVNGEIVAYMDEYGWFIKAAAGADQKA